MDYNFEKALDTIVELREKARKGNYRPVLRMLTTFLEEAADHNRPDHLLDGLIHRAILRMHQHERARSDNRIFLTLYFADVKAGLALAVNNPSATRFVPQLTRRMGDYYYEIGYHDESVKWYETALKTSNSKGQIQEAEYLAPLGRAMVLASRGTSYDGLKLLHRAKSAVRRYKKSIPSWHWLIIKGGVSMKHAEALYCTSTLNPRDESLAQLWMTKTRQVAEMLEARGYHQRMIQWRRLNRKLGRQ